jgi:hypothetical protein
MKRLVCLILIALSVVSCELGEGDNTQFVLGPIQEVAMASTYKVDSISQIMVTCIRPTECHIFNGFYYDVNGFNRTVAMEFAVIDSGDCLPDVNPYEYEVPLNFKPQAPGTYHFKFWNGVDQDGNDTFFEADAVVPN